jgi:hypothetical protein
MTEHPLRHSCGDHEGCVTLWSVIQSTDQRVRGNYLNKAERLRAAHCQRSIEMESDAFVTRPRGRIRNTPERLTGAGMVAFNTSRNCSSLRPFLLYTYFCNVRM